MLRKLLRNKKGQGLVEYGLIIAGVALISAASIAVFGHKVNDLISAITVVLPGAHADDNAPIVSGKIIETSPGAPAEGGGTGIGLDYTTILSNSDGTQSRLGNNTAGVGNLSDLVLETP
ncbi:MAG TPA: class III signal peptide-containing protein [Pirellulaceae bacterium]|nr:class III signal peptide-containing protein [Pirellulaceae bacterium]